MRAIESLQIANDAPKQPQDSKLITKTQVETDNQNPNQSNEDCLKTKGTKRLIKLKFLQRK